MSWRHTFKGKIKGCYDDITSRSNGKSNRPYLYKGIEVLSKEEFFTWAEASEDYKKLFDAWELSGFDRKLSPSVNRIDSSKGYIIGNIEWITASLNSSLGSLNRHYGGTIR